MAAVELGFVEERSDFGPFPSKVGGKPAWMVMDGLPGREVLACKRCQQPLLLLLQVSVPLREPKDVPVTTYHRMLYIFTCTDASCHRPGVDPAMVALRCQLPKDNVYYSPDVDCEEPNETATPSACNGSNALNQGVGGKVEGAPLVRSLCAVCGCSAPQSCGKCRRTHYCSRAHQVLDWKTGHRYLCDNDPKHPVKENKEARTILLKEFDIVTELEPEEACKQEGEGKSDEERMKEYHEYVKSERYQSEVVKGGVVPDDKEMCKEGTDKQYEHFRRTVAVEPEQVLRLHRGGQPLWVTTGGTPQPEGIPKCPHCGSNRVFEFQVLPQLLYYLKLDVVGKETLDWGTLAVYMCEKSCSVEGVHYVEEVVWKQDFSE